MGDGRDPGHAQREDDTNESGHHPASVDPRRLLDLHRHGTKKAHHEPCAEWDGEGRIEDHQRPPRVHQPEHAHDAGQGQEEDDRRHQVRHEERDAGVLRTREAEAGQGVGRGHRRHQGNPDHPGGHGSRVDGPRGKPGLGEQQTEVLEAGRNMEPKRESTHVVEVPLVLERGDHHPQHRDEHDHQKGREAGIDEKVPDDSIQPSPCH
jgi:hypothetical protein